MNNKQFIKKAILLIQRIKKQKKSICGSLDDLEISFDLILPRCFTNCYILYKIKKMGLIIKPYPAIYGDYKLLKDYIVPTIKFPIQGEKWCIQPLVNKKNSRKACNFFKKKYPKWVDNDPMNVGYWHGKPCIFDW